MGISHRQGQEPCLTNDHRGEGKSFPPALSLEGTTDLTSEQVNLTSGVTPTTGCAGMIPGVDRLGFPGLCLANAGNGVGGTDYVSAWPAGVHVAASWNKELTYHRAYGMGGEARIKGVNILLGPVVGPAGRVVQGGRNWEGKSNVLVHPGRVGL